MTIDNTNNVATGTSAVPTRNTAVAKKDAEVTCWNCLSSESFDRDVEPIPLSKVRKQHREKLRLYSFVASQVSKPRAVPLKQRVSENYSVVKKLDERISQEQLSKNLTENLNQELTSIELDSKLEGNYEQKKTDLINENIFTDNISQRFQNLTADVKKLPDINASFEKLKLKVDDCTSIDESSQSFLNVSAEFKDLSDFNKSQENDTTKAIQDSTFKTYINQSDLALSPEYNNSPEYDTKSANVLIANYDNALTGDIEHNVYTFTNQKKLPKSDGTPEKILRKTNYNTLNSGIDEKIHISKHEKDLPKFDSLPKLHGTPEKILRKTENDTSISNIDKKIHTLGREKDLPEFDSLPKLHDTPEKILRKTEYDTSISNIDKKIHTTRHEKDLPKFDSFSKLHGNPEKVLRKTEYDTSNSNINEIVYTSRDEKGLPKFDRTPEKLFKTINDNTFRSEIDQRSIVSAQNELSNLERSPGNVLKKEDDKTLTGDHIQKVQTISAEKMLPKFDNTYGKVLRNGDDTFSGNINESSQTLAVELEEELPESKGLTEKLFKKIDGNYSSNDGNNQRFQTSTHENKKSPKLDNTPEKAWKKIDNNDIKQEHQASLTDTQDSYNINKIPEVKVLNKVLVKTSTPRRRALVEVNSHKYSTLIEFKKKDDIIEELSDETDGAVTNSGRISSTSDKIDNVSCSGSDSGYAESSIAATESKDSVRDLSSPEPTSLTSDKTDNASCSGSECGYPESSSNVAGSKDYVRNLSSPDSLKSESLNKSCLRQNFKSSLPHLATTHNISAKSTTSLYSPMSTTKKTSEKYIRWSTLSIHQKPIAFGGRAKIRYLTFENRTIREPSPIASYHPVNIYTVNSANSDAITEDKMSFRECLFRFCCCCCKPSTDDLFTSIPRDSPLDSPHSALTGPTGNSYTLKKEPPRLVDQSIPSLTITRTIEDEISKSTTKLLLDSEQISSSKSLAAPKYKAKRKTPSPPPKESPTNSCSSTLRSGEKALFIREVLACRDTFLRSLEWCDNSLTRGKKCRHLKRDEWIELDNEDDETYVSDPVSSGHATLPRRSNSPLPHERDLGDRYSLNRSGLQARSESMASVYSGAGEGMRGSVAVRGDVQFSLLYNYRLGALEVGVRRCRDLAPVDTKKNRSDPYVKVYLLPDKSKTGKRKTKVKKNTLNPVFEETLSFVQPLASLSARTLWLSVWHADMFGRNDFLGEVTLPLADVVFDDAAPMWYKLHERTEQFDEQQGTRGDLIIGLKFEMPETGPRAKGTLHVLVKEAKNVVATKPNGLADVFCKSYLLPERGRLAKQKTTVCRRTLSPRWEHTFTYRGLTMQELATRALELSLWDRDRLASNDFMGAVRLSLGTGTYMGANVNWMDSVGKEVTLWQTMMQRPNFWVEGSLPLRPQLNN
ncbi:hypothetical protein MSG28_002792 [Choristoneura fumiferana]|uniref:Uncharacterized protein n=1 Tax=Choristoneura fumiferana TaxID=7141 RepID=A0ACC0JJD8_CHOFU|nr:hypothetical protein MSG28_002792 [Choristoneura fumiferana]